MKTSELIGAQLDYAVARVIALGTDQLRVNGGKVFIKNCDDLILCQFSSDWAQGGPIIDREGTFRILGPKVKGTADYVARMPDGINDWHEQYGRTALVAAMRCFVASRLGDEVEIPGELCK